jgi:rod shape-determining protein MreB
LKNCLNRNNCVNLSNLAIFYTLISAIIPKIISQNITFTNLLKRTRMGVFSLFTQELAIDLGTANTIIIENDKIVVDEPSIVALDQGTKKLLAIGETARQMHGKTHQNIRTIRPLRDGVIADFNAAEQMIRGMIKMINPRNRFFTPSLRMVVSIPSGSTEVEIRAVRDSSEHAGGP